MLIENRNLEAIREPVHILDYIKISNSCVAKETMNKVNEQTICWGKAKNK